MADIEKSSSLHGSSTSAAGSNVITGGGGGCGLIDSPGSCLSSGYCSDDAGSGHDDVFFGRHGKDCWMSSADVDTVDLLRGSLPPPFDSEMPCAAASVTAAGSHDSAVDTAVKFDDIVDNWLFNSMSVPSPCVDWPLPPPALSTSTSEGLDDLPTDSVLADLLFNQSAYTAASKPEVEMPPAVVVVGRKPEVAAPTAGACQADAPPSLSAMAATKRTLDSDNCESSAARRRRSSPCHGCSCAAPEMTSSSSTSTKAHRAATRCDCSTTNSTARRRSVSVCAPTSSGDVDLSCLSALRPEWPGFADVIAASDLESHAAAAAAATAVSLCDDEPTSKISDVEEPPPGSAAVSTESSRTVTPRPVMLEALLRSSSRLDANKGSSAALVLICSFSSWPKFAFDNFFS